MRLQLHKLEAYGFKSFADRLELEFDKGITAIVGPNGSGKSNITDAIKWVLGEQNIRNLRGQKAEDIIFSGSATRRALGIAEVSLTFDNSDGQLPLDFQEVVVTRRIFRSGESEYAINKAKCRLKDIHDLFADTGLGRDAISVISQNKIDQVLNSKPEERRLLFEEAAGITRYRNRKKESLKKLEDTQQNILRVTDILAEIEHQLEPLAEHAEKTRRYNVLYEKFRLCKVSVLLNDYDRHHQALLENEKQKNGVRQEFHDRETQMRLAEAEKEQLSHELMEVEKSLQVLSAKNHELGEKIERNKQDMAILNERLRQGEETKQRLGESETDLERMLAQAARKLADTHEALEAYRRKASDVQNRLRARSADEAALVDRIKAIEMSLEARKEQLARQTRELSGKQNALLLTEREAEEQALKLEELRQEQGNTERRLTEHEKRRAELLEEKRHFHAALAQSRENRGKRADEIRSVAAKNQEAEREARRLAAALQGDQTRLQLLEGMQQEYEGFGRGAKSVLKSRQPWQNGVCGAVAELIHVEGPHITAIEIALGGSMQNIVTENDRTAKQAIEFLKREKLGRVTFLPLNTMTGRNGGARDQSLARLEGFVGYASDLVLCDAKYQKIIEFLLGRTLVVDHLDTALKLARAQNFKARIVTLAGDMVNPGGSMTGGSSARREVSFLNRAGEIEALKRGVSEGQTSLESQKRVKKALEDELADLQLRLQREAEQGQQLEVKLAEVKVHSEKTEQEIGDCQTRLQRLRERITDLQRQLEGLHQQTARMQKQIAALEQADNLQKEGDRQAEESLKKLIAEKETLNQTLLDVKIEETVLNQEILRAKDTVQLTEDERNRCRAELAKTRRQLDSTRQGMSALNIQLAEIAKANEKCVDLREIGLKDHDNFHRVKLDKLVKIQENDRSIKELRRKYNELQNKLHLLDIAYTKYQFEVKSCAEGIEAEYEMTLEAANAIRLPESPAALRDQIRELDAEIQALGSINPNAIAEYESLRSRYDFMQKQANDLIVAKAYLADIIQDIDATMSKQFAEAFEKINEYFGEIFTRLFGGGQAELEVSDPDNMLEAGIEINVRPPDKKLQNLSVLSGGERALTVIALLFSFLKFKPAPFSVVDEIDAPLDEANVERFSAFLKEYAKHTQFIVVTHRKGTMQAADVMHGVTVEDAGVSRIISVRLEDEISE